MAWWAGHGNILRHVQTAEKCAEQIKLNQITFFSFGAFTIKIAKTIKSRQDDAAHCKLFKCRLVALGDTRNCKLYKFRLEKSVQKLGQELSEISIVRFSNIASLMFMLLFGSSQSSSFWLRHADRSPRSHNLRPSVRAVQVCLDLSFFIFLAQIFKQSVSNQSAVSQPVTQQSVSHHLSVIIPSEPIILRLVFIHLWKNCI